MDEIASVNADMREIRQQIHNVELEVRGASGKLDLIFLAQTDHETRIRTVERAVVKFMVYAAIAGACLSIIGSAIARKYFDDSTKPPPRLIDQYYDEGRRRSEEMRRDNEAYLNRGKQHDGQ